MAELSNHSYHYNRRSLLNTPIYVAPLLQIPPSPPSLLQIPPSPPSLLQIPPSPPSLLQIPPSPPSLLFPETVTIEPITTTTTPLTTTTLETKATKVIQKKTSKSTSTDSQKKKPRRKKRMLTGVSKQRRAANERERKRLQIINVAFKDLKSALPLFPNESNISKIEIVRLAARTIKYLAEMVNKDEDINDINHSRSPGGSEASDNSESCSTGTDSSYPDDDVESKFLDTKDIDISNLLFHPDDFTKFANDVPTGTMDFKIKSEERVSCSSSSAASSFSNNYSSLGNSINSTSSTSSSSSDGFSGFDINIFLDEDEPDDLTDNDVFPSMLSFW